MMVDTWGFESHDPWHSDLGIVSLDLHFLGAPETAGTPTHDTAHWPTKTSMTRAANLVPFIARGADQCPAGPRRFADLHL